MESEERFKKSVVDLYYDEYFKGLKGHSDWTDFEIMKSTHNGDIEDFMSQVRGVLQECFS